MDDIAVRSVDLEALIFGKNPNPTVTWLSGAETHTAIGAWAGEIAQSAMPGKPFSPPQGYIAPPAYLACFNNADVLGEKCLVRTAEGDLWAPGLSPMRYFDPHLECLSGFAVSEHTVLQEIDHCCLLLGHYGIRNHAHFLFDALPGVVLLKDHIAAGRIKILTPALRPVHRQILNELGCPDDQIVELDSSVVRCKKLLISSFISSRTVSRPGTIVRKGFDAVRSTVSPQTSPQYIYLSRKDSTARQISNEDEVEEVVRRAGLTPIVLTGKNWAEHVALFAGARLVIGPHGAGSANIGLALPGCVVCEIIDPRAISVMEMTYYLAALMGHRYALMRSTLSDSSGDSSEPVVSINTEALKRMLDSALLAAD